MTSIESIVENSTPGIRYADWKEIKPVVYAKLKEQGILEEYEEYCAEMRERHKEEKLNEQT